MGVVIKAIGESFSDSSLPLLRRDKVANNGTLDILDALDTYSWPSQAAPAGAAWSSLIGANTATFDGTVGFSAGFTTNEAVSAASGDRIILPDTFRFSTGQERCVIFWVKPGTQPAWVNTYPILGWGKAGTGDSPYLMYFAAATSIIISQGVGGTQIISSISGVPTTVQQFGFSFELIGGTYTVKFFRNGALVNSVATGASTLAKTGRAAELSGPGWFNRNYFAGTFYRALSDDLSVVTPEELVAADYAAYSARFS